MNNKIIFIVHLCIFTGITYNKNNKLIIEIVKYQNSAKN